VPFGAQSEKNGPFLGVGFGNQRAKCCPPKILAPLADSKFDVDYDFAIKMTQFNQMTELWIFMLCPNGFEPPKSVSYLN